MLRYYYTKEDRAYFTAHVPRLRSPTDVTGVLNIKSTENDGLLTVFDIFDLKAITQDKPTGSALVLLKQPYATIELTDHQCQAVIYLEDIPAIFTTATSENLKQRLFSKFLRNKNILNRNFVFDFAETTDAYYIQIAVKS